MDELFKTRVGRASLELAEERRLIEAAQAGDGDAVWALLVQYRGILQKVANGVRASVRGLTPEQVEDLQADLVLAAVEAVKGFDLERFVRLSQVMPGKLRDVATEMATSLAVPRGTLALWFKVWREAEQDYAAAADLAPKRGMSTDTFRAIQHALSHADSEWVTVPWGAGVPSPDEETHRLAEYAMGLITPAEREVVELVYGFRGDPKTDEEVALIRDASKRTVKEQRQRALEKMRAGLVD
ncbi:DNA binding protein [Microbacterium phage Sharkboy]|uniref:DNA binding protein n=3 Tax=Dismasvirus dismas TaxID=2560588 RepID=A0A516KUC1_9CAUD|nr:helix-turn-helix DNA binding protein [Microbacterium phage Dismas]AUG84840.1 DNA binding protein [Microbacterium phage Dismas]AVR57204.1 DNA binding protein [Microbacterium phage Kieran]QDP45280.1 DNA binding protein [Microbacterium phage Sharkboy]WNM67364.1 DNA binding protein [Microbacterium phage ChiliPepper]